MILVLAVERRRTVHRPLLALGLLVGALGAAAVSASTASNTLPESTAVHRATTVNGASALAFDYTVVGGQIPAFTVRVQKVGLSLLTSVTADFGGDLPVQCIAGSISIVDALTNLGQADYTCIGFVEDADRPRPLTINVS